MEQLRTTLGELGLSVRFAPIAIDAYEHWVGQQGKPRHIVTLLARAIRAEHIARVTRIIAEHGLNIDKIARLSGRMPLATCASPTNACVEFSVRAKPRTSPACAPRCSSSPPSSTSTSPIRRTASFVATAAWWRSTWTAP